MLKVLKYLVVSKIIRIFVLSNKGSGDALKYGLRHALILSAYFTTS